METALGAFVLLLVVFGCSQFAMVLYFSRDASKRVGREPAGHSAHEPFTVYFLIACLDEAAVIAETVRSALSHPGATVVLVDDASEDNTAGIARQAGGRRVIVRCRHLPGARQGKGPALNDGFETLVAEVRRRELDPATVVVVVMDADGRLSEGAVDSVLERFLDPAVGGVQLPVRIRNRDRLLTRIQDFEFWGVSAMAQIARMRFDSVSLGGNGQFTRLSALLDLGRDPWSSSLTEDLDLAVTLLVDGWKLSSTPRAHVTQQGVEHFGKLLRQRTRWFQGHMMCSARIPELWRSNRLPGPAFAEVTAYLLSPLLLVLPWSLLFTWGLARTVQLVAGEPPFEPLGSALAGRGLWLVGWYLVSFAPMLVAAWAYRRQSRIGLLRSLGYAHIAVLAAFVTFVAAWRAVARILLGRDSWTKTARHSEEPREPVSLEAEVA